MPFFVKAPRAMPLPCLTFFYKKQVPEQYVIQYSSGNDCEIHRNLISLPQY